MDIRGRLCTLYPVSWQGAVVLPTKFDVRPVADCFQGALAAELAKWGLDPRMPVPGMPDQGLVITAQIVRADPGSRLMRWLFSMFAGAAAFEIEGQVGDAATPFGQFHAEGKRRWAYAGGNSQALLTDAAGQAGQHAATQILAILAAR
ncbi:MAG TPA: DUF4410 domain-containing protein [Candidatus Limnocylindrales bacterium]